MSTTQLARVAGVLYLIVALFGGFAHLFVRATVYLPGDAGGTAQAVVANAGLVRVGVVADLLQATVFLFVGMTLYLVLSRVSPNAARAMVILVAIATTIICLNIVFQFAALLVATDSTHAAAFGAAGANALVLLLLDIQHNGYLIAQIFFGLWLVPLGYLAYRSRMFPKALGVLLVVGGLGYLVDLLTHFLFPDLGDAISMFVVLPSAIGEVWMVGYLLVKGARVPLPGNRASAALQERAASAV